MCFKVFALEFLELLCIGSYFSESLIPLWFGCWARVALLCHLLINAYYCYCEGQCCIFEVSGGNKSILHTISVSTAAANESHIVE